MSKIREEIYDIVLATRTEGIIRGKTKRFAEYDTDEILTKIRSQIDEMSILSEEQICVVAPDFPFYLPSRQSEIRQLLIAQKQDIPNLFSED